MPLQDELRLQKIIKSSDRVQEARALFGLHKGEYILHFYPPNTVTSRSGKKGRKVSSDSRDDMYVFDTDVADYVKENIIEYFGLKLDYRTVEKAIFYEKNFVPKSFLIWPAVRKGTGRFKISIEFYEYPNAEMWKAAIRGLEKERRLLKEMFRTKNTKGMTTAPSTYSQVKKISKFDTKFEITKKYKQVQKMLKSGAKKKAALEKLREKAALVLGKSGMTMDDLRKETFEFEKNFGNIDV